MQALRADAGSAALVAIALLSSDARRWFLAGFVLAAVGIAGHALRRD
jgi:hypothetical protein